MCARDYSKSLCGLSCNLPNAFTMGKLMQGEGKRLTWYRTVRKQWNQDYNRGRLAPKCTALTNRYTASHRSLSLFRSAFLLFLNFFRRLTSVSTIDGVITGKRAVLRAGVSGANNRDPGAHCPEGGTNKKSSECSVKGECPPTEPHEARVRARGWLSSTPSLLGESLGKLFKPF